MIISSQPRAEMALSAALKSGPSHAYLFRGPRGAGKRAAARAFAAEILASAADDGEDVRRRALLEELQRTIADPARLKAYLLKSSMVEGLRRAEAVE